MQSHSARDRLALPALYAFAKRSVGAGSPVTAETNHVFNDRLASLTRAISALEGHSFGAHFRFASFMDGLHHSCEGGWRKITEFGMFMPGTQDFAKELNEVMQPVMQRYAEKLRQELANECTKLGAAALKPPTFR